MPGTNDNHNRSYIVERNFFKDAAIQLMQGDDEGMNRTIFGNGEKEDSSEEDQSSLPNSQNRKQTIQTQD